MAWVKSLGWNSPKEIVLDAVEITERVMQKIIFGETKK